MLRCLVSLALVLAPGLCAQEADARTKWWKGNLHTHSLWSDGDDFPEMICDWYRENGYHFVALSDHNILAEVEKWMPVDTIIRRGGRTAMGKYKKRFGADWVITREVEGKPQVRLRRLAEYRGHLEKKGEFLLVQAEEVSSSFERLPIHMNVTNVVEVIPKQEGGSVREVMRKVLSVAKAQSAETGEPMLVHLNHPNFGYAITAEDLADVIDERFFEVWNGHPLVRHEGDANHASAERIWDIANTLRIAKLGAPPLMGLATDDSHDYHNEDPKGSLTGRGWVMVRAKELTPKALVEAMHLGEFYSSSGVTLKKMRCTEKRIDLEIEAVSGETYVTTFIGTRQGYDETSEPVLDQEGKELRATRRYSKGVGEVLARVEGTRATYTLKGDELYVRAVVTSSAAPERKVFEGQHKQAWLQPVGWSKRVR